MAIRSPSSRSITTSGAIYGFTMPASAAGVARRLPANRPVGAVLLNLAAAQRHKTTSGRGLPDVRQREGEVGGERRPDQTSTARTAASGGAQTPQPARYQEAYAAE